MENNAFVVEKVETSALHSDCHYLSHKPHSMAAIPHDIAVYNVGESIHHIAVYNVGESIHHVLLLLSHLPFPHYPSRICTPL